MHCQGQAKSFWRRLLRVTIHTKIRVAQSEEWKISEKLAARIADFGAICQAENWPHFDGVDGGAAVAAASLDQNVALSEIGSFAFEI